MCLHSLRAPPFPRAPAFVVSGSIHDRRRRDSLRVSLEQEELGRGDVGRVRRARGGGPPGVSAGGGRTGGGVWWPGCPARVPRGRRPTPPATFRVAGSIWK